MRKNLVTRIASLAVAATLAITAVPATNMATVKAADTNAPLVAQKLALTVAPKEGESGWYSSPELRWNRDENADGYKLFITDAEGNSYGYKYNDTAEGVYVSRGSNYEEFADISSYDAYKMNASGLWERVEDANHNDVELFSDGKTYNITVKSYNATGVQTSNTVSYTVGMPQEVTKISFVRYDEDNDCFCFDQNGQSTYHSHIDFQVSEDPSFATLASGVYVHEDSDNKACIDRDDDLIDGKTYYVRARLSRQNEFASYQTYEEVEAAEKAAWAVAPVTSFTVTPKAVKTPTVLTDVYIEQTSQNAYGYTVRYNTVLQDNETAEILYSTDGVNWDEDQPSLTLNDVVYAKVVTTIDGQSADSNIASITNNAKQTGSLSSLTYAEKSRNGYFFKVAGSVPVGQSVYYQWSEKADFATYDSDFTSYTQSASRVKDGAEFTIPFYRLNPGKTYYVRARVYNPYSTDSNAKYSAYTKTVSFKAEMAKVKVSTSNIKAKSLKLVMSNAFNREYLTGYEIQRKVGKKYVKVAKTTDDAYTVKKLKANTNYTFRVRPYYYNSEKGKTINGKWVYCETMTWGSALKLQAQPSGKTKVKLTWKKVSGAEGYEVYRSAAYNQRANYDKGISDGYNADVLVKDIRKGSAKSVTVSKLNSDSAYEFGVRAYKTINGKKYYISDYASVNLALDGFALNETYTKSNGSMVVTWTKNYNASGYLVEKYNRTTQKWVTYKKLGKSKTSITLPAVKGNDNQKYRVRAYKGKEFSSYASEITVKPYLAVVKNVKAKVSGEGVRVTWKAVSGASYYEVYRTTSSGFTYNKSTGSYSYSNGNSVPVYVVDASKRSGYRQVDSGELTATSLYDTPVKYTNGRGATTVEYVGPLKDVKYNYYVVAVKKTATGTVESLASKSASATVKTSVAKATLKSVKAKSKKVTVSWKKVSNVKGYKIYRSTKKGSGYQLIGTAKSSKSSYVDKKAKKGTTYYYKITAYKVGGAGLNVESKFSSVKKVKAK